MRAILILALIATACDGQPAQVVQQAPRQQVQSIVEDGRVQAVITTNRQKGEGEEAVIQRHLGMFYAWMRATKGVRHGDPVHEVDNEPRTAEDLVPGGDRERR